MHNEKLNECQKKITDLKAFLKIDEKSYRLAELNICADDEHLWTNPENAKQIMSEKNKLDDEISAFKKLHKSIDDLKDLIDMYNESLDSEVDCLIEEEIKSIEPKLLELEINSLFSGEFDHGDAFLTINSGAGGTESNDWSAMLLRMYLRWCERRKYKTEIIDKLDGEEAGVKSVTIRVNGERAYGWLRNESGVHRLVRISPFDSAKKRHTSFSSVLVYPIIEGDINIVIDDKDLRIDTYRSSGAGGQHVNKTDSAVRITHLPSGIVVASQTARSQHANKDEAMGRLKSMLYQKEVQERESQITAGQNKMSIEWGSQIRSYVLQPYQMVNDLRTEFKHPNPSAVLDGELDEFMIKYMFSRNK